MSGFECLSAAGFGTFLLLQSVVNTTGLPNLSDLGRPPAESIADCCLERVPDARVCRKKPRKTWVQLRSNRCQKPPRPWSERDLSRRSRVLALGNPAE